MKRIVTAICIAVVGIALLASGTYAYFSKEDTARNVITTGGIDFEICEKTASGEEFPTEGVLIMPGETVSKIVTVRNISDHPLYLRIKLTKGVNKENLTAEDRFSMNINETDWAYKEDGYYYYKKPLSAKQETEPLFTEVYINGQSVDNSYLGATFTLNIAGQAVQSENNGTDVFTATGWTQTTTESKK